MSEKSKAFDNISQQREYECLLKELRCVTCPNQNLADSSAPIAQAMQEEIYARIKNNESAENIRAELVSHYGDYIVYKPLFKLETYGLWFGPLIMLAIGFITWMVFFKRPSART